LKESFTNLCNKIYASARLALVSHLEYRFNLFMDAIVHLSFKTLVEMALWYALFTGFNKNLVAGFTRENYLAYALWAAFFSRVTTSWIYEHKMIEEIDSGTVNAILVRPISFYEFYLGQFFGYKILTSLIAIFVPLSCTYFMKLPMLVERLPLSLFLSFFYLIFVHTLSFAICSCGFFFNRVHSLTVAKNLSLWILSGELIPLDLFPHFLKVLLVFLPFSSGVFIPVAYLTGRIGFHEILLSFFHLSLSLILLSFISYFLWSKGRERYSGTGA